MLLVPSFYAFISLLIAYTATLISAKGTLLPVTHATIITAIAINLLATISFKKEYNLIIAKHGKPKNQSHKLSIAFLSLGTIGILQYIMNLKGFFGSISGVLSVLITSPHEIRWANQELANAPILVYFGWIGLFIYLSNPSKSKKIKIIAITLIAANLAGNSLFLDRTRPFWLIFFGLMAYIYSNKGNTTKVLISTTLTAFLLLALFVGIGSFIGKISTTSGLESLEIYLTGGIRYLNHIIENDLVDPSGFRLIYPIGKAFQQIGMDIYVPPQILPFYHVPFPTNVGTYMEPAYSDAGAGGLVLFILLHSFALNYVCLQCLKSKNSIPAIFWASICFSGALAFFSPKINTTFIYLIIVLVIAESIYKSKKTKASLPIQKELNQKLPNRAYPR